MNHQGSSFLSGTAPFSDLIYFAKMDEDVAQQGTPNSSFFVMDREDWIGLKVPVPWPAMGMATIKIGDASRVVVAVGPDGQYWEHDDETLKKITGQIAGEAIVTTASAVEQRVYACGMGRRVFRRNSPGQWEEIGPKGAPTPAGLTVIGFQDLSGFADAEIYTVGWRGEIWRFDQRTWDQIDSPASGKLNAVVCAADGHVYAVGDNGVMIRGRGDTWRVLDTGRGENLRDVTYYDGVVYVVTDFRILKLQGDTLVPETDFADANDRPRTCLHLLRAEDGLVSMGTKDLFRRAGGPWTRLV